MKSRPTIQLLQLQAAFLCLNLEVSGNNSTESHPISLLEKFQQQDYTMIFERGEFARYDKRYLKYSNIASYKFNRTTAVVNASQMYNVDVGHNLEVVTQLYKFASNEYRIFPMRFQANFCELVARNAMGVGNFLNCGTFHGCPVLKGIHYSICNWSPDSSKFPPFIPNGKYMLEFTAMYNEAELFVARGFVTISRKILIKS